MVLPIVAAVGATRLSAGHGAGVAAAGMVGSGVALVAGVAFAHRLTNAEASWLLYAIGLATMWSFSLLSQHPYGFDISFETHVLDTVNTAGVWHPRHPGDAYGAMLSLTVLPAMLHSLTGASTAVIFKVLYPAVFALFGVMLYALARRFLQARFAFVAAAFVASQGNVFQFMPELARQEIAMLLFVAMVALIFDPLIKLRAKSILFVLVGFGVVVSHYSTAYLGIAMVASAFVIQAIVFRFRRDMRPVSSALLVCLLVLGTGAALWYGPITGSASNAGDFTSRLRHQGLDFLPAAKPGQSVIQSYLNGNSPTRSSPAAYEARIAAVFASSRSYVHPVPAARAARYDLQPADQSADRVRARGPYTALKNGSQVMSQLANLLAVLGALMMALSRREAPRARQFGLLALGTLGSLALVRLSGTVAESYNPQRAFVQTLIALCVPTAYVLQRVLAGRRRRLGHAGMAVIAAAIALLFVDNSGLRGLAVGGGTTANLSDDGEDHQRLFMTTPELAAARWVSAAPREDLIYADRYGQLRLLATTGRALHVLLDPTPKTIDRNAWVYATKTNFVDGQARGQASGTFATYAWPALFLGDWFNQVYSNGTSAVYHR
jgi:uncharacterized membrane protein